MSRIGLIYMLLNRKNGNAYIGQTNDFRVRMIHHRTVRNNTIISNAIKKYGWDTFDTIKLHENIPIEKLDLLEKYYIKLFNTYKGSGYNATPGGKSLRGEDHPNYGGLSEEHKAKLRSPRPCQTGSKNHQWNKPRTLEEKKNISKAVKLSKVNEVHHRCFLGKKKGKSYKLNGKSFQDWRLENGWSRLDLAKKVGLSIDSIKRWELNRSGISLYAREKFQSAFNFDPIDRFIE